MRRVSKFRARYFLAALAVGFTALFAFPARADLVVYIDKSAQRMVIEKNGVRHDRRSAAVGNRFAIDAGRRK